MTVTATQVLRPRGPQIERITDNRAKVVIEPLERGYGHTLGNALRRVLLSSIPGFAITEVEIDGVLHEYTTVEGLQEDVLEVLLNLKDVAIRMHSGDSDTLELKKQGPGVVTAGDIKTSHNVEVLNPDHVIANLTKDVALNMRLTISRGFGYQPAAARRQQILVTGTDHFLQSHIKNFIHPGLNDSSQNLAGYHTGFTPTDAGHFNGLFLGNHRCQCTTVFQFDFFRFRKRCAQTGRNI